MDVGSDFTGPTLAAAPAIVDRVGSVSEEGSMGLLSMNNTK